MRVGVTAPEDGYERYRTALALHALIPVAVASVRVEPGLPSAMKAVREAAESADLIFVTSSRAVAYLWPDGAMPTTAVAAVGATTAAAVRQAGGNVVHVGTAGASLLLDDIQSRLKGTMVVYPRAGGAHPAIINRLDEVAGSVVSETVYTTIPIPPPADPVEAVVFASPSAVEGWFLARDLDGLITGAIGATTAAALLERGIIPHAQPSIPSAGALAAEIALFQERISHE